MPSSSVPTPGPALTRPILYLDVDDTIIDWALTSREDADRWPEGRPAAFAGEFLAWALIHFEVRWLTYWCSGGVMEDRTGRILANLLGLPEEDVLAIRNPIAWVSRKDAGIDWAAHETGRRWAWVEDAILDVEECELERRGAFQNFYRCHCTQESGAVLAVWRRLAEDFSLPAPPESYVVAPEEAELAELRQRLAASRRKGF